jgi:3-oxoacyl-[acyl-carrier protein] reductase
MPSLQVSHSIVTGGTEGIGRAIALALGQAGAKVAVCARTASRVSSVVADLVGTGIDAIGESCDVSDEQSVARFVDFVSDRFGSVDLLVNNAGLGYARAVDEMRVTDFDEIMAVNVRGVFLMTRAVLPEMKRRRQGAIVNIASLAGKNGVAGAAAYSASKHAVLGFSKSLMLEVRKYDIRVVTVCPGSVVTPFFEKSGVGLEHPERKLQPNDIAEAVVAAVLQPSRATISELDIRPTNP